MDVFYDPVFQDFLRNMLLLPIVDVDMLGVDLMKMLLLSDISKNRSFYAEHSLFRALYSRGLCPLGG